jgi:hypothetical protein
MAVCQAMGHEIAVRQAKGRRPSDFGQVGVLRVGRPTFSELASVYEQLSPFDTQWSENP